MKTIFKSFACAAAAALALASCAKENLVPNDGETDGKKLVKVHFSAETTDPASSRATLTPDEGETAFAAAWETGDAIGVKYANDSERQDAEGTTTASWKETSFESSLPEYTGMWIYDAAYPVPDATDSHVDFGPARTQKGNAYNSKYDIMIGSATAENAAAGKDDSGSDIVFQMERKTAIAYFHFTSDLDESITSATLTVRGEGAAIASSSAYISNFKWAPTVDCTSIALTFPEEAPNARDFTLWFNVLPTSYTKMTLTVETATKTFTISKNSEGTYEAGKLYKVKKDGIAWEDKGGSVTPSPVADVITANELAATDTQYADFSNKSFTSAAVYAGNSAKTSNDGIQLRSKNSNSGIVTTVSGGNAKKISIVTESGTNTIDIYGKATPYTSAANLYATANGDQGTKLGSLTCGTDTELEIEGDYPYIGIRSNNGAIYLTSITITWETGSSEPAPDTYSISFADVTGGTLSANPASAEAGAEITLTATPDEGYEFKENSWKVVAADDSEITVTDGKFIMPASDVTVTASFVRKSYLNAVASKTTVSADGETVTVTVDTNVDGGWTAESSDETNFTIGNKTATTFDVTVSKNETEAAREATITVTAGTMTETITLTQKAAGQTGGEGVIGRITNLKDLTDGVYVIVGQQTANSFGKLVNGTLSSGRLSFTSSYTAVPSEMTASNDNEKWRVTVSSEGKVTLYSIGKSQYLSSSSGKFSFTATESSATSYTVSCLETGVFTFTNGSYVLSVNKSSNYWRDYATTNAYSSGACLYLYRIAE